MPLVCDHLRSMRRLRRAGIGSYVVMTPEAGKAGLDTRYPIGAIVGFSDTFSVKVRKLGQATVSGFAAGFWQLAPNRLIACVREGGDGEA